jgi:hypothetical protein
MFNLFCDVLKCCAPVCADGMSARAARDKMYEHASAVLAKSSSHSRLFHENDRGVGSRTEKSGELGADIKPKGKKNILVYKMQYIFLFGWAEYKTALYVQH